MPASGESAMQAKKFTLLAGLFAFALTVGLPGSAALAQEASEAKAASSAATPTKLTKPYFVEFRSRSALSYGHAFLVHGKLNAQGQVGQVRKEQVEGLHPFSESSIPWSVGHAIPVPAEHGWSDGDTEDEYITARYRVLLTEAEYRSVLAYMADLRKKTPMWHAVLYNCTAYIGDVAKHMGLKAPSPLQYPDEYISEMAAMNGGRVVLLNEVMPQKQKAARPASTAAKPVAAKPAAAKPAAPKPAADPSAPSASSPTPAKPAAAKPAPTRRASATAPAVQAAPVGH
jgi:hypothetical protein